MRRRPDTFMPMYWGDYLRDTSHLTTAEHGAYLLLIGHYWTSGKPLPAADAQLSRIARMTAAEWRRAKPVVAAFFQEDGGAWNHRRIDLEITHAAERYAKRAEGARITNANRDAERGGQRTAVEPLRTRASPSPSHSSNEETPVAPKGAIEEAFERLWKAYPHRGKEADPRKPAAAKFAQIVKAGGDPELIIRGAEGYARAQSTKDPQFNKQLTAWLNQAYYEQYAASPAEQPSQSEAEHWRPKVQRWADGQEWYGHWGLPPNDPGCRARLFLSVEEINAAIAERNGRAAA